MAINWKPIICDNCAMIRPIAEPDAFTSNTSFEVNFKVSVQMTQAVIGLIYICAAVQSSIESGIGTTKSTDVFTYSCHVPSPRNGSTLWPMSCLDTEQPTSVMILTPSYPGILGNVIRCASAP